METESAPAILVVDDHPPNQTAVEAVLRPLGHPIRQSEITTPSPYNTYLVAGLPPGPIANPGMASLKAVLAPAESEALYFVLRPGDSGAHEFSTNIAKHEAAIAKYRRGLQR